MTANKALQPNGCSGGISFFWKLFTGQPPKFEYCCDEHDLFYIQGGSASDRLFADRLLRDCLRRDLQKRGKDKWLAGLFYLAVRAGGWWAWWIKPLYRGREL